MSAGDTAAQQMSTQTYQGAGVNSANNPYFQTPMSMLGGDTLAQHYGQVDLTGTTPAQNQFGYLQQAENKMQSQQAVAAAPNQAAQNQYQLSNFDQAAQANALTGAKANLRGVGSAFGAQGAANSGAAMAAMGSGMGNAFANAQLQTQQLGSTMGYQNAQLAQQAAMQNQQFQQQAALSNAQLGTQANLAGGQLASQNTNQFFNQYTGTVAPAVQSGLSAADIQKGYGNS